MLQVQQAGILQRRTRGEGDRLLTWVERLAQLANTLPLFVHLSRAILRLRL